VEEVTKDYGKVRAVNALSLDIPRGQIMALLGKNGAGKSTLIDIILGLQAPTSGTARVFGLAPRDAIRRSLVGVVLQTGSLPVDYTVAEALRLFGSTHDAHVDYGTILEETQLAHMSGRVIRKLSGGEQQRVRLALALLPDPHLLILDEPTAGMDATARREFWDLMRTQAERGRTLAFSGMGRPVGRDLGVADSCGIHEVEHHLVSLRSHDQGYPATVAEDRREVVGFAVCCGHVNGRRVAFCRAGDDRLVDGEGLTVDRG